MVENCVTSFDRNFQLGCSKKTFTESMDWPYNLPIEQLSQSISLSHPGG